jgi:long-chain acyl-CoA synthetase
MIDNRFLKLTGRVNELYKLENGKFVMPSLVESALGRSNYISQNCVIGANRPFNIALVVPDMVELTNWMKAKNIQIPSDPEDEYQVLHYSEVVNLYHSEVLPPHPVLSFLPLVTSLCPGRS